MTIILEFEVHSPLDNERLKFKTVCIFLNWDDIEASAAAEDTYSS